jgi:ribonuclease III family protein
MASTTLMVHNRRFDSDTDANDDNDADDKKSHPSPLQIPSNTQGRGSTPSRPTVTASGMKVRKTPYRPLARRSMSCSRSRRRQWMIQSLVSGLCIISLSLNCSRLVWGFHRDTHVPYKWGLAQYDRLHSQSIKLSLNDVTSTEDDNNQEYADCENPLSDSESQDTSVKNLAQQHSIYSTSETTGMDDEYYKSNNSKSLIELLSPSSSCRVNQMSGTDLAYIGDVVYEMFIRSRHVWPSKRTSDLQHLVVGLVRAEYQSKLLNCLREKFTLSNDENQVLMRGRNSVTKSAKNRKNPSAYQDSTAFECLIGYLFIADRDRCTELLAWLDNVVDDI